MNWAKKQANAERVSSSRVMAVGPAQAVTSAAEAVGISVGVAGVLAGGQGVTLGGGVAEILAVEQVVTLVEVVAEILAVGAVAISKAEDRGARHAAPPFYFCPLVAFIWR